MADAPERVTLWRCLDHPDVVRGCPAHCPCGLVLEPVGDYMPVEDAVEAVARVLAELAQVRSDEYGDGATEVVSDWTDEARRILGLEGEECSTDRSE